MSTHACIDCDSPGDGNCAACHGSGKTGTESFIDTEGGAGGVTCSSCGATRGDTAFLKTLFGERMFEVQPDGHAASAEEMLKGIATRKPGQIEGYCDQIQIRGVYGDTAILTDRRVRKGIAADGRDVSGQWRVTRVFVKQDGKWRAVAAAMTPIG